MRALYSLYIKLTLLLIVVWAGVLVPGTAKAQAKEYLLKAGYVEKFTHFVEWPEAQEGTDSEFKIAVFGEGPFGTALEEIFRKVKVKNRSVKISYVSSVSEIRNALIVVISNPVSDSKLAEILRYTTGKQILTISENQGYGQKGVIINILVVDNYIRYEINRTALQKSGLKMSSLLLNTAIIIN